MGKKLRIIFLTAVIAVICGITQYCCTPQTRETGRDAVYGLCPTGDLFVWGVNEYQMADINSALDYIPYFMRRVTLRNVTCVSGSYYGVMAVDGNGDLWGKSLFSALIPWECAVNKNGWSLVMSDIAEAAVGNDHCIAVQSDGSLWIWGAGSNGAGFRGCAYPQKVMEHVTAVYASDYAYFAITDTNEIYAYHPGTTSDEFVYLRDDVSAVGCIGNFDYYLLTLDGQLLAFDMATLAFRPDFALVARDVAGLDETGYITTCGLKWTWSRFLDRFVPDLKIRPISVFRSFYPAG